MKTVLRWIANLIVLTMLWLGIWWVFDLIPLFDVPLFSTWSVAKMLGFFLAMLILTRNRDKFPWLRLERRK